MRKIILAVMVIAAIGFVSCGNKTDKGAVGDSVATEGVASTPEEALGQAKEIIEQLKEKLQAGDATAFAELSTKVKTTIDQLVDQGDSTVTAAYTSAVSSFLNSNKEAIEKIASGESAVNDLVDEVNDLPSSLTGAVDDIGEAVASAPDAAKEAVENAASSVKENAEKKADEAVSGAKEKAAGAIDDAASKAKKSLGL